MPNGEAPTVIDEIKEGIETTKKAQSELEKTQLCEDTCGAPHAAMVNSLRGQSQLLCGIGRWMVHNIIDKQKKLERKLELAETRKTINYTGLIRLIVMIVFSVLCFLAGTYWT